MPHNAANLSKGDATMKTLSASILVLVLAISAPAGTLQKPNHLLISFSPDKTAKGLEGEWNGTLDTGGQKLRVVLKVKKGADGKLTGTIDSLDQNAKDIPISKIDQTGAVVKLELAGIGASYEGKMNAAGSEIAGQWKQGGGALPLTFQRSGSK